MVMARLHCVFKHWWMRGLKNEGAIVANASSTAVQKFKKKLRWSEKEKWFDCGGVGILAYAVVSNEVHVVEELLKVLKRDFKGEEYTTRLESRVRDEGYTALGVPGGTTTLMAAMMVASTHVVALLLRYGVSVSSLDVNGTDALTYASFYGRADNIKHWIENLEDYDVDIRNTRFGSTSLLVAAQIGPHKDETVRNLLKFGARLNLLNDAGVSILIASCSNEDADPSVVKQILNGIDMESAGGINYQIQSRTRKWKLLRGCAKLIVRGDFVKSVLATRLAYGAGLTALHYAARRGDVEIVTLLLEAGADPYLENEMGLNSFDITEKFGPFPSVMRVLNKSKNN